MKHDERTRKNWVAKELSSPKYRQRIVKSKKKYTRNGRKESPQFFKVGNIIHECFKFI